MEKIIEAEVIENIDVSQAVVVTQKPIIAYTLLKQISDNVIAKIEALNIDNLAANEDNLALIKRTRADLTKDFAELENQRKTVKDIVLNDYNIFEDDYKKLIASPFKDADAKLKNLSVSVDDKILSLKIVGIKEYFMDNNTKEWLSFEDMNLKIIKSKSDKIIKSEIDDYLANIKTAISTIDTLQNKERVLAKFQIHKDLNRSISETNLEVQREEQIKAQNAERERIAAERKQQAEGQQKQREEYVKAADSIEKSLNSLADEVVEDINQSIVEPEQKNEDKIYETTFTVRGTMEQLSKLKQFMKEIGVR